MAIRHQIGFESAVETEPIRTPGRFMAAMRKSVLRPLPCAILAATGIFGGLSALFIGLVCVILHGAVPGDTTFSQVGTVLLVVAIPMILIGAIFLDEIEVKG